MKMKLEIKVDDDLLPQFSKQLGSQMVNDSLELNAQYGSGHISLSTFPNSLELYHFKFNLTQEIEIQSANTIQSEYFLANINLSEKEIKKNVNGQDINFQRYLPSGILFYPIDTKIASKSPAHSNFEIVLIRFHRSFLSTYFESQENMFQDMQGAIVYEDLDVDSEKLLQKIITSSNTLTAHASLLSFLSVLFDKFRQREKDVSKENLHADDIKSLFFAASMLRNPTANQVPTLDELAKLANMGKTKFKNSFKQIFGNPPMQYHNRIKMEYAKEELLTNEKGASEIAYELGYAHPSKFTRAFKNYYGVVPSKIS